MRTKLPEQIKTVEEARKFLKELHNNGESYHPVDDANDVIFESEVSQDDRTQLNKLMDDIYELNDFDPCEYLLDLMKCDIDVVLIEPGEGEESMLFRVKNYNEETRKCYIEPVHFKGSIKPQELVSMDDIAPAL